MIMDWEGDGRDRPGPDASDMFDADREALNFLDAHRLDRTTTSYRLALQAILHPESPLGREVTRRTDGGVRLTEEDVKALRPLVHEPEEPEAGSGQGPLERDLDVQAEKLESLTSDARQITSDFSHDMVALSQANTAGGASAPDAAAIAALLEQLIARIAKTESDLAELSGNIAALRTRIEQAPHDEGTDTLTGTLSPSGARALIQELPAAPYGYVLATCGLDDLDNIEDRYGRSVADNVLRAFVATLRQCCGDAEIVRWQENLFLVLLRGRPLSQVASMMEDARAAMLARTLRLRGSGEPIGVVTLSAGVAVGIGVPMEETFERAEALRAIASAGLGNRVVSRA